MPLCDARGVAYKSCPAHGGPRHHAGIAAPPPCGACAQHARWENAEGSTRLRSENIPQGPGANRTCPPCTRRFPRALCAAHARLGPDRSVTHAQSTGITLDRLPNVAPRLVACNTDPTTVCSTTRTSTRAKRIVPELAPAIASVYVITDRGEVLGCGRRTWTLALPHNQAALRNREGIPVVIRRLAMGGERGRGMCDMNSNSRSVLSEYCACTALEHCTLVNAHKPEQTRSDV